MFLTLLYFISLSFSQDLIQWVEHKKDNTLTINKKSIKLIQANQLLEINRNECFSNQYDKLKKEILLMTRSGITTAVNENNKEHEGIHYTIEQRKYIAKKGTELYYNFKKVPRLMKTYSIYQKKLCD